MTDTKDSASGETPRSGSGPTEGSGVEELFADWLLQQQEGGGGSFEAWAEGHAGLRPQLDALHASWTRVARVHERLSENSLNARIEARYGRDLDPGISLGGDESGGGELLEDDPDASATTSVHSMVSGLHKLGKDERRYTFRNEIARGGMGAILRVWDKNLRRVLAMKVMLEKAGAGGSDGTTDPNTTRVSRFLEEAQITGQLDHPGILPVHETGIDEEGRLYFTMPLVKGSDLKTIIDKVHAEDSEWNETRALNVILRVCQAMSFAHSKGVIHRDLKPANIMVGRFGETYVMDWGLAKVMGRDETRDLRVQAGAPSTLSMVHTARRDEKEQDPESPIVTMDGDIVGTPAYMSPEQAKGKLVDVGPQSDVYAVGALLYHLLTGQMPYVPLGERVSPHTVLNAVRQGPPWKIADIAPDVPDELVAICEKAMARELGDRYPDMHTMGEDLRAFLEGHVVHAYETGAFAEFRKWVRRNKALAGLAAGSIALAFGGLLTVLQIQTAAKERLAEANEEITLARDAAVEEKQRADENAAAAMEEKHRADASAERVQRQAYRQALTAAEFSLRLLDLPEARSALESTAERHRNFAWHHLDQKSDASLYALEAHRGSIFDIALTRSGTLEKLVTFGRDRALRTWDTASGEMLSERVLGETYRGFLSDGALSRDGQRFMVAATQGIVGGGLRVESVEEEGDGVTLRDSSAGGTIVATALAVDGSRAACLRRDGKLRTWDARSGEPLSSTLLSPRLTCLAFGPYGKVVAVPEYYPNNTGSLVALVDVASGDILRHIPSAIDDVITAVQFDAGGKRLAIGGNRGGIRVFDMEPEEPRLLHTLNGHEGRLRDLAFTLDGSGLTSGSDDRTVRAWSLVDGKLQDTFIGHSRLVGALAMSADGRTVFSAEKQGPGGVGNMAMRVRAFSLDHPGATTTFGSPGSNVLDACFDSTGSRFASTDGGREVKVWDANSGAVLNVLRGHRKAVTCVAISPDDRRVATGAFDNDVILWEASTGQVRRILSGHGRPVETVTFSPDGRYLLSGARDKDVIVWDVETGEIVNRVKANEGFVLDIAVNPNGTEFAVVGRGQARGKKRYLRVFSLPDVELRSEVITGHTWAIEAVAYAADGKHLYVASRDDHVSIYDVPSYEQTHFVQISERGLTAVSPSPDGKRLAFGVTDGSVEIWDAENIEPLLPLDSDANGVNAVQFGPRGKRLLCALNGGLVRAFESESSAVRYAAQLEGRRLELRARPVVTDYFDEVVRMELVISLLVTDRRLDNDVREAAMRIARIRGNDPAGFHDGLDGAANLVERPLESLERYALGLKRATHAVTLVRERAQRDEIPIEPRYLDTLALAKVRMGNMEEALQIFEEAAGLHGDADPPLRHLVLRSIALCLAGEQEQAEPLVEILRERSRRPSWIVDRRARAWLDELRLAYGGADVP